MSYVIATINDKIKIDDGKAVYATPLDQYLKNKGYGEISVYTTLNDSLEVTGFFNMKIFLSEGINPNVMTEILTELENLGAPKGSKLTIKESEEIPFGKREGLGLYLNFTNPFPEKENKKKYAIYEERKSDIYFIMLELQLLTNTREDFVRQCAGETYTALFLYGPSFDQMKKETSEFINTHPSCKGAKVVQVA